MPLTRAKVTEREATGPAEERRNLQKIMHDLEHAPASVRRSAALALGSTPDHGLMLVRALLREHDASVRSALITALAGMRSPEVASGVAALIASEDAATRSAALEILSLMDNPAAATALRDLLNAADPDLRILALQALAASSSGDARNFVVHALEAESDTNAVVAAIEVLASCGDPADLTLLQQLKSRFAGEPYIEFAVQFASSRIASRPLS